MGKLPRSSFRHKGSGLNTPTWDPHAVEDQSPWQRGRCPDGAAAALRAPYFWVVIHLDRGWELICDRFRVTKYEWGKDRGSSKLSLMQPQSTERLGSLRQGDGCSPGGGVRRQAGGLLHMDITIRGSLYFLLPYTGERHARTATQTISKGQWRHCFLIALHSSVKSRQKPDLYLSWIFIVSPAYSENNLSWHTSMWIFD